MGALACFALIVKPIQQGNLPPVEVLKMPVTPASLKSLNKLMENPQLIVVSRGLASLKTSGQSDATLEIQRLME